jgi:hypothetical protein
MNEQVNPWTARITYRCGHTRTVEMPNRREYTFTPAEDADWMAREASYVCVDCLDLPKPQIEYISGVETAKLIRQALKRNFPGITFSVRYKSYSGGSSIDVSWTDGPRAQVVERVTSGFAGAGFDGMIDLKTYHTSWLEDDGSAHVAHDSGTGGSKGSVPEHIGDPSTPGARQVHFGTNYVFCNHTTTPAWELREHYAGHHDRGYDADGFDNRPSCACPQCQYQERMQRRGESWIVPLKPTIHVTPDGPLFVAPDGVRTAV